MADIFDEVNDDLRAERARQFAVRYGGLAVLLVVLVVAGVGAWRGWLWYQGRQAGDVASAYMTAMRDAGGVAEAAPTPARIAARETMDRLAATAPRGYRSLARLRGAALRATSGDLPGALADWDQLASDTAADPLLRDLASLLWVQHQVDAGDPQAVAARLQTLLAPDNPWRPLAMESQAWLALRTGHPDQARDTLQALAADAKAPDGVRGRANGLLTQLGGAVPPASVGGAGG